MLLRALVRLDVLYFLCKRNKREVGGGCQAFFSGAAKNHEEKKIQQEDSRRAGRPAGVEVEQQQAG
jgi:hypothetical protein